MLQLRFSALLAALAALSQLTSAADLQIGVLKKIPDCKRKAQNSDVVHVHYTGKLKEDGSVFDSSLERGQPIAFPLGAGRVIEGWDKGILGMCIGEKRKLTIPSELGYGSRGAGGAIPPNADLVFTVELVKIEGYEEEVEEIDPTEAVDPVVDEETGLEPIIQETAEEVITEDVEVEINTTEAAPEPEESEIEAETEIEQEELEEAPIKDEL